MQDRKLPRRKAHDVPAAKPSTAKPIEPATAILPAEQPGHKQRFEQLLDDVVLGVPPKR